MGDEGNVRLVPAAESSAHPLLDRGSSSSSAVDDGKGGDGEAYGDLSDVPPQRLKEVKAVIKSTRDLWRKGSGVPGDPWFRLGIVGVWAASVIFENGSIPFRDSQVFLGRRLADLADLAVIPCDPQMENDGLVVKHHEDASTDISSDEVVATSPDILKPRNKGNKLVPTVEVSPATKAPRQSRRRKKEQKEVSSLRSELRAKGNEVMSEVAQCSKASQAKKEDKMDRISLPPGLAPLPEKPLTEANNFSWREVEKVLMLSQSNWKAQGASLAAAMDVWCHRPKELIGHFESKIQ
ncbi:unnamed protein product [Cladocopium goreaui]|uniref:Uncharacterized protein n=1 Tax=Cladocopium goreaui TaxID=2562237 RepID=A0A9P1DLJ4_9DINO|nr:unnamed protein product [Cladocopium goreaui]